MLAGKAKFASYALHGNTGATEKKKEEEKEKK